MSTEPCEKCCKENSHSTGADEGKEHGLHVRDETAIPNVRKKIKRTKDRTTDILTEPAIEVHEKEKDKDQPEGV